MCIIWDLFFFCLTSIKPAVGSYPHQFVWKKTKTEGCLWHLRFTVTVLLSPNKEKRKTNNSRSEGDLEFTFKRVAPYCFSFEINEQSEKERVCGCVNVSSQSNFVYLGRVGPWGGWKVPCQSQSCRNVPTTCVPKSPPSAAGWEEAKQPSPKPSAWRETDRLEGKHCRLPIKHCSVIMLGHQNFGNHLERP